MKGSATPPEATQGAQNGNEQDVARAGGVRPVRATPVAINLVGNALVATQHFWGGGAEGFYETEISNPGDEYDGTYFTTPSESMARACHLETIDMVRKHKELNNLPADLRLGNETDLEERNLAV